MKFDPTTQSQTLYIPIASPPTPSPSPTPLALGSLTSQSHPLQTTLERRNFLTAILNSCTPAELAFVADSIAPLLKRDFLSSLPPELYLHILSFINEPCTLVRASAVSREWQRVATAELLWKGMCAGWGFGYRGTGSAREVEEEPLEEMEAFADLPMDAALEWLTAKKRRARHTPLGSIRDSSLHGSSYRRYFRECYIKLLNWERGGHILRTHKLPMLSASAQQRVTFSPSTFANFHTPSQTQISTPQPSQAQQDSGVVTSLAVDSDWVVVGLASSRVHVFSARTGVLARTLVGHDSGVWGICLVSASQAGKMKGKDRARDRRKERTPQQDVPVDLHSLNLEETAQRGTSRRTRVRSEEDEGGRHRSLPSALRAAVGLEPESDSEDDDRQGSAGGRGVVNEDEEENYPSFNTDHRARPPRFKLKKRNRRVNEDPPTDTQSDSNPESPKPNRYTPERQSDPCFASEGWGQPNALVISGGCDKVVRVWDVKSGHCIYTLPGHTSTIRCMRTLHGRPLAVTGSRDGTLRTWDIQRGRAIHVLRGHLSSVRCLDVNGNRAVSGSYDSTCRIWDLDTGECIHVLRGHFHQVYTVSFDGVLVATGGLDTTVRVWNADTGQCIALLQNHTALVCQLQLSRKHQLLVTGGSDGRVITFSLASSEDASEDPLKTMVDMWDGWVEKSKGRFRRKARNAEGSACARHYFPSPSMYRAASPTPSQPHKAYEVLHCISAHDSSVTTLQFDGRFLVTGGNDGRVRLWETQTGRFVREMCESGECIWKVGFTGGRSAWMGWAAGEEEGEEEEYESAEGVGDVCVIVVRRWAKTVLEVWGFGEN